MSLKLQMFQDNVLSFTPKGAVIKLPKNGTEYFAYAVHTKIGDKPIIEINGKKCHYKLLLKMEI